MIGKLIFDSKNIIHRMKQEVLNNDYYLKNVKLSGYKSIKNVDVDFERGLNIIIGKNASGKTNFLTFLYKSLLNLTDGLYDTFSELLYLGNDKLSFKTEIKQNFSDVDINKLIEDNRRLKKDEVYEINNIKVTRIEMISRKHDIKKLGDVFLRHGLPDKYTSIYSPFSFKLGDKGSNVSFIEAVTGLDKPEFIKRLYIKIYVDLKAKEISKKSIKERLKNDFFKTSNFTNILKQFTPIKDLRFNDSYIVFEEDENFQVNNLLIEFFIGNNWHPFSNLSDGTKRLFYIISEVFFSNEMSTILIEEPELGIHPHQLHDLMTFLKEESLDKQIIITTHSPLVLDILNEDELDNIIITKYENGETTLSHLDKRQKEKAKKYMEEMYLSDYWKHSDLEE